MFSTPALFSHRCSKRVHTTQTKVPITGDQTLLRETAVMHRSLTFCDCGTHKDAADAPGLTAFHRRVRLFYPNMPRRAAKTDGSTTAGQKT